MIMTGLPVAFSFFLINIFGLFVFWNGFSSFTQILPSIFSSTATFVMVPVVLFIFMGEILFHSGIANNMIYTLNMLLGRLPGRLSLITVGTGTLLGTLTGNEMATTAILGRGLLPEMDKAKYSKDMSLGAILGAGGLAILIPPSDLAIIMGALGKMSIGRLLLAIIFPGLIMATILCVYIITRCSINKKLAPVGEIKRFTFIEKLGMITKYILPISIIVFLVVGIIFIGIATPSEAAATGALGAFILTIIYGKLNWKTIKNIFIGTIEVSAMIMLIVSSAALFSQILSYTGITQGLVRFILSLQVKPIVVVIGTQLVVLILGMFMDVIAIMMITVPLFAPIIVSLGLDPVWWGVLNLISITVGGISPPFGLCLFVLKGVAPKHYSMKDIYRASVPRIVMSIFNIFLVMAFPQIALWLPSRMG